MNLTYTSNPSLIEINSAPAVAQSGLRQEDQTAVAKGLPLTAVLQQAPINTMAC